MNISNTLTCSRPFLAAIFAAFLFWDIPSAKIFALVFFVLGSLTDYWDGRLARSRGEISEFGKLMDPIADKILTLSAFFSFWFMGLLPLWMVLLVAFREIYVTLVRLRMPSGDRNIAAKPSGKRKTVFQLIFIIGVLLYLIVRETPVWRSEWSGPATAFIHGGMALIVLVTLWSGVRALLKK